MLEAAKPHTAWLAKCPLKTKWGSLIPRPLKMNEGLSTSKRQAEGKNRPINDNLEAMAKQLYDYWFVQFDFPNKEGKPYKSSGGKMVWNDKLKREIPENWLHKDIKSFMRIFTGKKDVSKAIPGPYKFFSCAPEPITSDEYIYDGAAVLVSGNGSYTGRVNFYKGKMDLYQRTYACVVKEDESTIPFFYYTLRYLFQPIFSGGKHGSSIPYIVLGDLADFMFAYNVDVVKLFVENISAIFNKRIVLQQEIENLTKQRDELLPLLMNGQVSVNYHLSVLQVVANIGKFSYFIGLFLPSACRFEVDSPSFIFNGRGIRLPHFVFTGHLASQGRY